MKSPLSHKVCKCLGILSLAGITIAAAPPRPHQAGPAPQQTQQAQPHLTGSVRQRVQQAQPSQTRPMPTMETDVKIDSELMITDLSVVEDRIRTNPRNGHRAVWTFRHLMENMAGDLHPADFTMNWLKKWETDQMANEQVSEARPAIRDLIIDPWLAKSGGSRLDLNKAPFKLLAIVNRMDLRSHDESTVDTAGEGRFVFGILDPDGNPLPPIVGTAPGGFVVIFEYELIADSMSDLKQWANDWHALGRERTGSPRYNAALERVTRNFTDAGKAPNKPNSNPINQIRTNELALSAPWELREFVISPDTGHLVQQTVAITPGTLEINGTELFRDLINDNEEAILDGSFTLSNEWFGASSLSGPFLPAAFPGFADRTFTVRPFFEEFVNLPWSAAGINSNDARHKFAVNTCNGCHNDETGTSFLQVGFPTEHNLPASLGNPAELAGFLTGITVDDPVEPITPRSFNDLERRQTDLQDLIKSFGTDGRGPGPKRAHRPKFVH